LSETVLASCGIEIILLIGHFITTNYLLAWLLILKPCVYTVSNLTEPLNTIIRNFSVGAVASVNDEGKPSVTPIGTFVVVDDASIAFGNIRSQGTVSNLQQRPDVEISFVDILNRRAARIRGRASIVLKNSEKWQQVFPIFEKYWGPYVSLMRNFIIIDISDASLLISPAYDLGLSSEELRETNLNKLNALKI
jgi:general stress protein 26